MQTNWDERVNNAKLRSEVYGLLSTVFREEPNHAFIQALRGENLSLILKQAKVDLGSQFYSDSALLVKEQLAIEFSYLFLGPESHISAHESVFCEVASGRGGLWGKKTVEVKAFIQASGLDYDSSFNGIPDHISVELEFMHKLIQWEAEKWHQKESESALYCLDVQHLFLEQHLLNWAPQFCEQVIAKAKIPFYRAMSELTLDYIEFEREQMKLARAA